MPSVWLRRRQTKTGEARYRVEFRVGGRESRPRYAGSFRRKEDALGRKRWVAGELAAMRVPNVAALVEPIVSPAFRDVAKRWQASRVDVRDATTTQHRTALNRVLPVLGDRRVDGI